MTTHPACAGHVPQPDLQWLLNILNGPAMKGYESKTESKGWWNGGWNAAVQYLTAQVKERVDSPAPVEVADVTHDYIPTQLSIHSPCAWAAHPDAIGDARYYCGKHLGDPVHRTFNEWFKGEGVGNREQLLRAFEAGQATVPAEVDVRVVVETWAAELADPIPYNTDATGPIPKPVAVPSVDVEVLIHRLTTHVGQPATEQARAAAEEIVPRCLSRTCFVKDCHHDDCWGCDDSKAERERVAAIITKHSDSRGDGEQMRDWQPIASAPMDESWQVVGRIEQCKLLWWHKARFKKGYWQSEGGVAEPTHWLPLPATVLETIPVNDDNGLRAALEKIRDAIASTALESLKGTTDAK